MRCGKKKFVESFYTCNNSMLKILEIDRHTCGFGDLVSKELCAASVGK